jgi:hypothetical protein
LLRRTETITSQWPHPTRRIGRPFQYGVGFEVSGMFYV